MERQKHATGYEPLNTLKPVAPDIWLIDGPPVSVCGMPYPTRCTVVRLTDGDLWVHSPTLLTDGLREELQALGPVRYLIAANRRHFMDVASWQRAFPQAKTIAAPGVATLASRYGAAPLMDDIRTQTAPVAWAGQIDHLIVGGSKRHGDVVFFHRASSTLIVTNLIQNLETAKLPTWMRPLIWLAGIDDSDGKMSPGMRILFRKAELADFVEAMIRWAPERMILAHGRWYRQGATDELRRAFRRILRDREWAAALEGAKKRVPSVTNKR